MMILRRDSPMFSSLLLAFLMSASNAYQFGEKVVLWVNKVGPYFNPHETYHYYKLPVCRPDKIEHKSLTLGEVLDGDRMAASLYNISFRVDVKKEKLCGVVLKERELKQLREAIEDLYYFEFVVDELPVHGFVGNLEERNFLPHQHKVYLWTHHTFHFLYNHDKIIAANVSTSEGPPLDLDDFTPPLTVTFTYSVDWTETQQTLEDRRNMYQHSSFFPKTLEIHWLSIINSAILVTMLMGFVVFILSRTLRRDFARYNAESDFVEGATDYEEYGWKILGGDVFRPPPHLGLFCAILGVGVQFLCVGLSIITMALSDLFNVHRHGFMNALAFVLYALTSVVAGFVSSSMYKKMGGKAWVWNVIATSLLFSGPFVLVWSVQNSVAWAYASTQALPFTTVLLLLALWLGVGFPLCVLGGVLGKNLSGPLEVPCRTKHIPREVPPARLYHSLPAHCALGGFLPFSAVSVELYYVFGTAWGRESYHLWGVLGLVFLLLLGVTACVSVSLTYFLLSNEDHRWWWRSLLSAGSTGVFVFLYALFYYVERSNMGGLLQAAEFFGHALLACYVFFLALGTVSFYASLHFVRYLYRNVKAD